MDVAPIENPVDTVRRQLDTHIRECAATQRWTIKGLVVILLYMAAHDAPALARAVSHTLSESMAEETKP